MPSTLMRKYFGKDVDKSLIKVRDMGAILGASLIISGLVLKYTKNDLLGAGAGVAIASTGGPIPAVVSLIAFFPSVLTRLKAGVRGTV